MNGRVIGHYRVLEKIGSGAMGEVFRARDERLARDVAIKLIRDGSNNNPDHLRRFELEARSAAALNHPNIVAIYDFGLDEGTPYIVCELLEGKTLRMRLSEGALPVQLAVQYSLQIVQGLIAAHHRRITHRDLKPENLFVSTEDRIKILDFGVAKLQASPDEDGRTIESLTTVTRSGMVIGTVAYMAPEQLRGKPVDHRSDIFSVGAILYEMLAGRRAFRGETEVDTITAVLREEPPESELSQAGIPASFRQIVRHCLEKDPEKRFQSARDLCFALETLSDTSTASTSVRMGTIEPPKPRTNILPWAIAGVLLIATLLLLWKPNPQTAIAPSYRRLTFDEGTLYSARFAPDFRSVIYSAAWNGKPLQLFSSVGDSLSTQPLNIQDGKLLAVSKTGELALTMRGAHVAHLQIEQGTLARAPLAGGSPRELLEDVRWADWAPNGDLAVVHYAEGSDRIEFPIGHVLYQSGGWISHIRFSAQGDRIAFINHPALWDDRGLICVIDLSGHIDILSKEWDSADGLAWGSDGKEIWFTAAENGYTRGLLAVDLSRKIRTILRIPAGMTLQDIAPDGRVLASLDAERVAMATTNREGETQNISWHDWDVAKDISRDGKSVLFEDASEAAPPSYSVAIRRLDGTPPVQLGEGSAGGLSPDGKWAIAIIAGSPGRVTLYPTGAGEPRAIAVTGLERIHNGTSHFLADGKRITINGNEPNHGVRCYVLEIETGKLTPVTPEGITGGLVSTDGRYIIAKDGPSASVYPTAGGNLRAIPGLDAGFVPLQLSEDDSAVYGYRDGQVPAPIYKVNLVTGAKTVIQTLEPKKPIGVVRIGPIVVTHDASRFAYSYYQVYSVLHVISGLR
jgi:eukaryotic-like serine/threonine-protein kinase